MGGLCGGMSLTPNSKVSRSVRISANGASLAGFLSRLALDSPPLPVRILFEPEGASCWTMNAGKTLMVMFDKHPIDGLKVKQPCVIICNPKELSDLVRSKSRGETVKVSTEASEPIRITTKSNGGAEIMPADEDDCLTIPDRNILPIADDQRIHICNNRIDESKYGNENSECSICSYDIFTHLKRSKKRALER